MKNLPRSPLLFVLPGIHLVFCIIIALSSSEGSWQWFPVFFIDLPFSLLLVFLQNVISPILVFGILGTLWWYIVSLGLLWLGRIVAKLFAVTRKQIT
jgi:hypothetical protein